MVHSMRSWSGSTSCPLAPGTGGKPTLVATAVPVALPADRAPQVGGKRLLFRGARSRDIAIRVGPRFVHANSVCRGAWPRDHCSCSTRIVLELAGGDPRLGAKPFADVSAGRTFRGESRLSRLSVAVATFEARVVEDSAAHRGRRHKIERALFGSRDEQHLQPWRRLPRGVDAPDCAAAEPSTSVTQYDGRPDRQGCGPAQGLGSRRVRSGDGAACSSRTSVVRT